MVWRDEKTHRQKGNNKKKMEINREKLNNETKERN